MATTIGVFYKQPASSEDVPEKPVHTVPTPGIHLRLHEAAWEGGRTPAIAAFVDRVTGG
jgi:hypothetical protein